MTCQVVDLRQRAIHTTCMESIWDFDWRPYPAAVIALIGLLLGTHGGIAMARGFAQPIERPGKNLVTVRAMRMMLQGISVAALALGWWLHWPVMVAAGAIVGFEETLETSIAVWALNQEYEADAARVPRIA